ncbi:methyltransferase [Methylomonas sp. AM2-LC]|uniref:methyltransferase n=1 Tax=Methylomonas sp. AM2-LC TaxID=3153301 RepID=UPI0032663977
MKKLATNTLRVKLFNILMGIASALQNIPAKVTPPPFRLMQIGSLFWQSRALYVATKLELADTLGDSEKSTLEIASALHLHEDHLYRLLRMLSSMGIFDETAPRVFKNSKTSAYLRQDNPKNVRAMILMHNSPEMTMPWMESLEESIRDGGVPFSKVHGVDFFNYMDQNKNFDLLFSQAMDAVENLTGNLFLDDFNWGMFDRIIDVGGSKGSKTLSILKLYPNLKAVVFDRPQIIEEAKTHWQGKIAAEILARADFQGGDMFEFLPAATSDNDLFVFSAIFHGLNNEECTTVLSKLKIAIGTHQASVLFADAVAEETNINPTIAAFDMQMLIGTTGRERTPSEWKQLLENAGFEIVEIMNVRTFVKFIIAKQIQTSHSA